jgi:hypothetical protein
MILNKKIKEKKQNQKLFLLLFFSIFFILNTDIARASTYNVFGWAWTENIGWISFNNASTTGTTGTVIPGGGGSNYGVYIDGDSGRITGYAWSENIGWIRFDPVLDSVTTTYPDGTTTNFAKVDLQNPAGEQLPVSGWIRACSVFNFGCSGTLYTNRGGWDGWIYLDNITINKEKDIDGWNQFHQWVWGSSTAVNDPNNTKSVVGWGTFNCAEGSASGGNYCGTSNYKVVTILETEIIKPPPEVVLNDIVKDPCTRSIFFSWTYVSGDGGDSLCDQTKFIFQVSATGFPNDACSNCVINRTIENISGDQNNQQAFIKDTLIPDYLTYNTFYNWRVKVFDGYGHNSGWKQGTLFKTELHPYPNPNYSVELSSKTLINGKSTGTFKETQASRSLCAINDGLNNNPRISYYNCNELTIDKCIDGKCYSWWFDYFEKQPPAPDNFTIPQIDETLTHEYNKKGTKRTQLQVCDDVGCCTKIININIAGPSNVPIWQEISPF